MDVSDFLKSGRKIDTLSTFKRKITKESKEQRNFGRHKFLTKMRNITNTPLSEIKRPEIMHDKKKLELRQTQLKIWKAEREKRKLEEQKSRKIPFKYYNVNNPGPTSAKKVIEKKNNPSTIKSKKTLDFGHQKISTNEKKGALVVQLFPQENDAQSSTKTHSMVTRSKSTSSISRTLNKATLTTTNKSTKSIKKSTSKITNRRKSLKRKKEEKEPEDSNTKQVESDSTPTKTSTSIAYISPYVTLSRGKDKARKEYKIRKSMGGVSDISPDITGPKAGSAYFYEVVNGETEKINNLCKIWETYKNENSPPEEACDMINTAIGQAQLLLSKKFQQFHQLINSCANEASDNKVTCEDLHGFWDMVLIQVNNIHQRFHNLTTLKSNDWNEIIPIKKKNVQKKKVEPKKKAVASQAMRDAIKAAKAKARGEIFTPTIKTPSRKSLVQKVLMAESEKKAYKEGTSSTNKSAKRKYINCVQDEKKTTTSPGLTLFTVTQFAKEILTPNKSILKSSNTQSTRKKSVMIVEERKHKTPDLDKENEDVFVETKEDTPLRRSGRIRTRSLYF